MINGQPHKRWPFWLITGLLLLLFIYLIRSVLLPFVLGIFIAYFLHPAANQMVKNGLPRIWATLLLIIGFFSTIMLIGLLVVPMIANQVSELLQSLPDYIDQFDARYMPMITRLFGHGHMVNVKGAATNLSGEMVQFAGKFATGLISSGMAFVHALALILITPVVAFYLLRDWQHLVVGLDTLLPRANAPTIRAQLAIIDRTLSGFIRGQLNVCLILAAYYSIALSLAGLKFGAIIGIATGLMVVFPYVGLMLGITVALSVAFFQFQNISNIAIILAVFFAGASMESGIITPKLVGDKVGLHPVWIIFGMLSGGALFGLVGVLLAVPATAVIGVLIRFAMARYLESEYYRGEPVIVTEPLVPVET